MGQVHSLVVTLYPFQETALSPGFVPGDVDSYATHVISELCRMVAYCMEESGQVGDVRCISDFHVVVANSSSVFDISISDKRGNSLPEDMNILVTRKSEWRVWLLNSIDIDGIKLEDITDCEDYLKYLFDHDMHVPSDSVIRSTFYKHRNLERQNYRETVNYRQELVKQGKLDSQYVYTLGD